MSDIIFKLKNPLTISSSNFVITTDGDNTFDTRDFDGLFKSNVKFSLPQSVGTTDSVQFNQVTLSPNTLTVGTGSNTLVLKDGSISGSSPITFQNDLLVTQNATIIDGFTFTGTLATGSSTIATSSVVETNQSGSTIWGENLSQKQFFSSSLEVTGSVLLNRDDSRAFDEISNDTSVSDESNTALVTERVVKTYLATLKPQRNYLRKSFVHTGSFVDSTNIKFVAITASAPFGMSSTSENDFMFFVNGMVIENDALTIVQNSSTNLSLTLNASELGYSLESDDEVIGFGKFDS